MYINSKKKPELMANRNNNFVPFLGVAYQKVLGNKLIAINLVLKY